MRSSRASSTSWSSTPRTAASTISTACSPAPNGIANATAGAEDAARPRRPAAAAPAAGLRGRQARDPPFRGPAERAVPHRRAADRRGARTRCCRARSTPTATTASRSTAAQQHVRRHVERRRLDDGLLRRLADEAVALGASEYTLADNFFMGAFGGSYLNHQWLICACTPRDPGRAASACARSSTTRARLKKRPDSPLGHRVLAAVRAQARRRPGHARRLRGQHVAAALPAERHPARRRTAASTLADPAGNDHGAAAAAADRQDHRRHAVGEGRLLGVVRRRLERGARRRPARPRREAHGHLQARAGGSPIFQPHHQPFNYYARFAPGHRRPRRAPQGRRRLARRHRRAARCPQVAFYKPAGQLNQHPSYTDLMSGDEHIDALLDAPARRARSGRSMLVIVTYDENGGFWDHVPPPSGPGWGDRWGPGIAHPDDHRLAVRQARLRRQDALRHDVDPEADHASASAWSRCPACARRRAT